MSRKVSLVFVVFLFLSLTARAAILVEDGKRKETNTSMADGTELRKIRRVAVGVSTIGPLGVLGANLELNFTPQWAFMGGFGTGLSYQSFTLQVKRVLAGEYLMPYMAAGISRWYTVGEPKGPITKTQPAFLYDKFLNDTDKIEGQFSKVLLYPAFGLQYMQLSGDWSGMSLYAEVLLLLDIGSFEAAPTGTLGMLYYF